jgi:hypothetical protein
MVHAWFMRGFMHEEREKGPGAYLGNRKGVTLKEQELPRFLGGDGAKETAAPKDRRYDYFFENASPGFTVKSCGTPH